MQVIDMGKRKKSVKRSVNRGGDSILSKGREGIVANQFVFVLFAAIEALELFEPIEVKQREAGFGDGAEVASAAFHSQDTRRFLREGIGEFQLRTGIAAAEIGDAQIRSQQVRAVAQEGQLVPDDLV